MQIPEKLYFRIGEVARLVHVEPFTLRFWETEFPQLKPGKGGTGQRLYRRRDVEMALEIRRLLYTEGYTISGARQFLQGGTERADTERAGAAIQTRPSNAAIHAKSLRMLRRELQEIAGILARPVLARQANVGVRGAHGKTQSRAATETPLPLFTQDVQH